MQDYIIAEDFILPSLGKVYGSDEINPHVKLRSMTTNDEMKRLNHSERAYKVLADVIDDCLVEGPGISAYDLCLADFQFLLHKLRTVTYGPEYKVLSTCPYCKSTEELTINLEDFEVKTFEESVLDSFTIELPITKKKVKLSMQTPRSLDDVEEKVREYNRKTASKDGTESAFLFNLEDIMESVDGKNLDVIKKPEFIKSLPMRDTNYIIQKAEALDRTIGLNTEQVCYCPMCGLDYTVPFRFTSEFFRPTVD